MGDLRRSEGVKTGATPRRSIAICTGGFGLSKILTAVLPFLLTPATALADESMLLKCRSIEEPAARLACYDALVPAAAAPVAGDRPEAQFGLKKRSEQTQAIESHIPGRFEGWRPKTRIRLANGQVWEISDGSSGAYRLIDPKIRIRRGALGAYFLEIEGENRSPRVQRVE